MCPEWLLGCSEVRKNTNINKKGNKLIKKQSYKQIKYLNEINEFHEKRDKQVELLSEGARC